MAKIGNRILESFTTTGTGTIDLDGAVPGHQSFLAAADINSGDTVAYVLINDLTAPTTWEIGRGTITSGTPDTLSRDTVIESSNAGSQINWGSGTKYVACGPYASLLALWTGGTFTGPVNFDATVVINDAAADVDFRVEGLANNDLFFCDASLNRIGINTLTPTATLNVNGSTIVEGTLRGNANVVLGEAATADIDARGQFISDLIPDVDSTYDLGSASLAWANAFIDSLTLNAPVGSSTAASGYVSLPGGIVLQWGNDNGSGTVSFPVEFPTQCRQVFASANTADRVTAVTSFTTLNFNHTTTVASSGAASTSAFSWLAIGF